MENVLEIKNSNTDTEVPIKSEIPVQNAENTERNDASPPPNCSICLGKLVNTSFTDSCLHRFCFTCLLQWSKIKAECPLCKQTFKSIIHNVRSEKDYDQYHVPPELAPQISPQVSSSIDTDWDDSVHRYVYRHDLMRVMMSNRNRQYGILLNPAQVARREQIPIFTPNVPLEERRRRRNDPIEYRRNVYRLGTRATALCDVFGRFHECNAEFYRRNPQELDRLIPWLNRELRVLLDNEPHIAYLLAVIMEALTQHDISSLEFRNIVRPFLTIHTDHFGYELLNFARTNFDLIGYDQYVTYLSPGFIDEYNTFHMSPPLLSSNSITSTSNVSSNSSINSDHSDIRILDEAIDLRINAELQSTISPVIPISHAINMPGTSNMVEQRFRRIGPMYNVHSPELLTVSSTSESDDECEIIGYVKPRHERTPVIIDLSSDSDSTILLRNVNSSNTELIVTESHSPNLTVLPSTFCESNRRSLSSSTSDDSSDDDYNPRQKKQEKKTTRKNKRSYTTKSGRKQRSKRRRSNSSDSSSSSQSDSFLKKYDEKRSRKVRYKVQNKGTGRIKIIKKEENYIDDSSNNCSNDSDTDSKTKTDKSYRQHRSKKKNVSSSDRTEKSERTTKNKEKASTAEKLKSKNKDQKHKGSRQSRSRSISESSNASDRGKRSSYKHCDRWDTSGSRDGSASMSKDISRKEHRSKSKKKTRHSSDSEDHLSSQCSNHSNKSYSQKERKKSGHKERKCKDKEHHRSSSRTYSPSIEGTSASLQSKNNSSLTKHSDRASSSYKEKHKSSRRIHKEPKYKKSENDKSKPKKKQRLFSDSE